MKACLLSVKSFKLCWNSSGVPVKQIEKTWSLLNVFEVPIWRWVCWNTVPFGCMQISEKVNQLASWSTSNILVSLLELLTICWCVWFTLSNFLWSQWEFCILVSLQILQNVEFTYAKFLLWSHIYCGVLQTSVVCSKNGRIFSRYLSAMHGIRWKAVIYNYDQIASGQRILNENCIFVWKRLAQPQKL
jgi:hypothetical protein